MRFALISVFLLLSGSITFAQSNIMEGNNSFAMFTKTGDIKQLEAARKFADEAYKSRRDSSGFRNNLLRSLVYSTLAVVDSNRTMKYPSGDPIDVALSALNTLKGAGSQTLYDNEAEIKHVRRSLANAYLVKANRSVAKNNYEDALRQYKLVDSLGGKSAAVDHNIAVLTAKVGNTSGAITRYEQLIKTRSTSNPSYIIELANIYRLSGDSQKSLNTLLTGREQFPGSKDILFQLINMYVAHEAYNAVVPLIDEAIAHEPENVQLNYIAGFANESEGNSVAAKRFYEKVISLDANNFDGNFELGLLYLKEYIEAPQDGTKQNKAQEYLLKANQIKPAAINTLKSLAVLYEHSGDTIQLERVNSVLNQQSIY